MKKAREMHNQQTCYCNIDLQLYDLVIASYLTGFDLCVVTYLGR